MSERRKVLKDVFTMIKEIKKENDSEFKNFMKMCLDSLISNLCLQNIITFKDKDRIYTMLYNMDKQDKY